LTLAFIRFFWYNKSVIRATPIAVRRRGIKTTKEDITMYNEKKTNYGKIIAITVAAVTGACAIIWFALKLYRKYCLIEYDYDAELDDESLFDDALECEVVMDEAVAEEAPAEA
jgi:hypothetical protein